MSLILSPHYCSVTRRKYTIVIYFDLNSVTKITHLNTIIVYLRVKIDSGPAPRILRFDGWELCATFRLGGVGLRAVSQPKRVDLTSPRHDR